MLPTLHASSSILFLLLLLLLAQPTAAFNPRVTCLSNQLIYNIRFTTLVFLFFRDPVTADLQPLINKDQGCGSHYGRPITTSISTMAGKENLTLASCKNFYMSDQSCCLPQRFQNLAFVVNKAYNSVLADVKYPIIKYAYNLINNLNSNGCNYARSRGPDSDPGFISLIKTYKDILKKIQINERQFINETLCLVCLGTKDYPNFIYPYMNVSDLPLMNNIIYERKYFESRTQQLLALILQLESLHTSTTSLLAALSSSITPGSPTCNALKSQSSDLNFLGTKKLCTSSIDCKKLVVRTFGLVATPQLLYYIGRISNGLGMMNGPGVYVIGEDGVGFRGNLTYTPLYGRIYLPNATMYNGTANYVGLY